jgi:hypothetical protein
MAKQTIKIARGRDGGGIGYLAVLAYPLDKDRQSKFIDAGFSYAYKASGTRRMQIPEKYRRIRPRDAERVLRSGFKKIQIERMCSAYYTIGRIFHRNESDWSLNYDYGYAHPRQRVFAVDKFIELLNSGDVKVPQDEQDFNKRMWKNSKPALHLMLAIFPFDIDHHEYLLDFTWSDEALKRAEGWRLVLPDLLPNLELNEPIQLIPA